MRDIPKKVPLEHMENVGKDRWTGLHHNLTNKEKQTEEPVGAMMRG